MLKEMIAARIANGPLEEVSAHCDGPCGVYDPASARIAAEAALSMTKKILALAPPDMGDPKSMAAYLNTFSRYVAIKEEQAHIAKSELLVLWTDYFKPVHLAAYPNLHDLLESRQALLRGQSGSEPGPRQRIDGRHSGNSQHLLGHKEPGRDLLHGFLIPVVVAEMQR
jgi:nickel-type superoxide dismutase